MGELGGTGRRALALGADAARARACYLYAPQRIGRWRFRPTGLCAERRPVCPRAPCLRRAEQSAEPLVRHTLAFLHSSIQTLDSSLEFRSLANIHG